MGRGGALRQHPSRMSMSRMSMRRRDALTFGLGAAATLLTRRALAQSADVPRVGILDTSAPGTYSDTVYWSAFQAQMAALGYIAGKTVRYDARWAEGDLSRLPDLTSQLVRSRVRVIMARSTPVALAARTVTKEVPIIVPLMADPVGIGLVKSLARPGGNITGMSLLSGDYSAKWLAFLKEAAPKLRRVGVLQNPGNPVTAIEIENVKQAAPDLGLEVAVLPAGPTELEATLTALQGGSVDGFVVTDDAFFEGALPRLVALAAQKRLPALYGFSIAPKLGGLMSYSADFFTIWRHLAAYVDRILKGALPADLPVEQATEVVLNINLKVAKTLGLTIPQTLLISANEVIE